MFAKRLFYFIKQYLIVIFMTFAWPSAQASNVLMHFYQQTPPFITSANQGYLYDLAEYINRMDTKNMYSLKFMPRELINRLIDKKQFEGVVIGANPAWFDDIEKQKYFWSVGVFDDANDIISDKTFAFDYKGPDSLAGLTLGGIRGHYYVGLDPLIKQGLVYRDDVDRVTQNLRKAVSGRVSVAIINRSFLQYYLRDHELNFHISKQPHAIHQKHIFFTQDYEAVFLRINRILKQAKSNGDLERLMTPYR